MVYQRTDGRSVDLISLVVSIHGRPQASIAAIFRQFAGYVSILLTSIITSRLNIIERDINVWKVFVWKLETHKVWKHNVIKKEESNNDVWSFEIGYRVFEAGCSCIGLFWPGFWRVLCLLGGLKWNRSNNRGSFQSTYPVQVDLCYTLGLSGLWCVLVSQFTIFE